MSQHPKPLSEYDIIAISGKQYSGKDVLARLLLQRLPSFRQIPLAGAIKKAYAVQKSLTLEEVESNKALHRSGLIAMGDWGRKQDPDYWLRQVLNEPGQKIISDVRLKREYEMLKSQGAFMIRLNADRDVRSQRGQIVSENDPTELELDDIEDWDLVLVNNGTLKALQNQINNALKL